MKPRKPYTHIEPRTEVSDAALARGDREAWYQVLGLRPPSIPFDAIGRRHRGQEAAGIPGGHSMSKKPTQLPPAAQEAVGGQDEHPLNERNISDSKRDQDSGSEKKPRDTAED